jgi:hypothetical protein
LTTVLRHIALSQEKQVNHWKGDCLFIAENVFERPNWHERIRISLYKYMQLIFPQIHAVDIPSLPKKITDLKFFALLT